MYRPTSSVDPDLREYQRTQALTAIAKRYTPKGLAPLRVRSPTRKRKNKPLFVPEADEVQEVSEDDVDPNMSLAIEASLESEEAENLRRAIEASKAETRRLYSSDDTGASSSKITLDSMVGNASAKGAAHYQATNAVDSDDDLYASPTRLETALSIANAGPKRSPVQTTVSLPSSPVDGFGQPTLLLGAAPSRTEHVQQPQEPSETEDDDFEEVEIVPSTTAPQPPSSHEDVPLADSQQVSVLSDSDEDLEPVVVAHAKDVSTHVDQLPSLKPTSPPVTIHPSPNQPPPQTATPVGRIVRAVNKDDDILPVVPLPTSTASDRDIFLDQHIEISDSDSDGDADWSRAASPVGGVDESVAHVQKQTHDEDWDTAQEMDPQAEEGEFARFVSQVRGRDLEEVRKEIDDEIRALHEQRKVAMRDSEDVTQHMVSQIMVRLWLRVSFMVFRV